MPRLYITRPLPDRVLAAARAHFDVEQRAETGPLSGPERLRALAEFDAVLPTLGDAFDAEIFAEAGTPRARILANFGVGYNHIDIAAAAAAGVVVTNTPGAVTDATADIAMTLTLMTCRRAGEGERLVRAGRWEGWHPTQLLGMHLGGKTLGIVGMGRIGQAVGKRAALGFGMEVIFHNRSRVTDLPFPAQQCADLQDLLARADVLVLVVPATPQTRHLIDATALAAMKPSAYLVNVARGDVVDEAALIAALQSGRIAGAGLDVYEHEPQVPKALTEMENVTLLPHMGTSALDVREEMGLMAVENLRAFFEHGQPPHLVTG